MFSRTHVGPHSRKGWPKIIWPAALLMLTALLLLMPTEFNRAHAVATSSAETPSQAAIKPSKSQLQIPVTLYVMSQCPDAMFCQRAFKPVMEALPGTATLHTAYIATLKDEESVQCMHGSAECDGNKQQLCLQHHLPAADNRKFVAALLCHSNGMVNDVQHLQKCMTDAGIGADVQADVLKCVDGTLGATLQVASAKQVKDNAVRKSCTVFVDGVKRCIRDGGRFYDCPSGSETQDFITSICDAYTAKAGKASAECEAALGKSKVAAQARGPDHVP